MSVNEIGNILGAWDVTLSPGTPRDVLDALLEFGRLVILPGRLDPVQYGDTLLTAARYTGVLREKEYASDGSVTLSGSSMVVWLGDEDGKGPIIENAVTAASGTFANAVNAVLPDAVTAGTIYSVPGTAAYTIQWKTPRQALDTICDLYGTPTYPVEYRVNGDATVDAGRVDDLYGTVPKTIVVAKDAGYDLDLLALPGKFGTKRDVEDYTTRAIAMSQGEGDAISTAVVDQADIGASNPYLDPFGQPVVFTRLIDSSDTEPSQLATVARLQLGRFQGTNDELTLSTTEYDIAGDVSAGDYIWAYDPDAGLYDLANEIVFRGQRLNPMKLRVLETTWPIVQGTTVAYRHGDGTWIDLSDYVDFDAVGETSLKVAGYDRSLTSSTTTPPGDRVNGDTSIPATPVFGTFAGNVYESSDGETKAQILVTWTEPLNQDGSTIVDGDHYEIRWRPNVDAPYPATWTEAAQGTWDEVFTWDQPRVAPITSTDWHTFYAGWDTDQFLLQELTPSVIYEFQIRAVDGATPANKSQWSVTQAFTAPRDTIPPSTPAAPEVDGSRIAIQVVHRLGVSTGGTFNLEADTNHLEIHVSNNPTYFPDETTLVGRLLCGAALRSQIAVVGTFPVEEVDERYVKVVAVDRNGNKSPASDAATATAELIDDAHISDLSVSKVTAGEITADWLLSASIRTGETGQRLELNAQGLQAYDEDGAQTINLSSDPEVSGNYITFQEDGVALAGIDEDGNISGQTVSADAVVIDGDDLMTTILNRFPRGLLAIAYQSTDDSATTGADEMAVLELNCALEDGRMYRLGTTTIQATGTHVGDVFALRIRDAEPISPDVNSNLLARGSLPIVADNSFPSRNSGHVSVIFSCDDSKAVGITNLHSGTHRILLTFARVEGTGTAFLSTTGGLINPITLTFEDLGPLIQNTAVEQSGTGGGTAPVKTYTKTYPATWSGSYSSSGAYNSFYSAYVAQGDAPGTSYGNQRGLIGFDASQIADDVSGATVQSVTLTMNAVHWYQSTGGTAVLGTHNYSARPSTWTNSRVTQDRLQYANWPRPGKRTVALPISWVGEIAVGITTGIAVGPGPSSSTVYYGRFDGASSSNRPVLTVKYTK
ncbi:hypothetical protein [Streptomyces ortus]|uniref:Fibronectin type-III domain-containing protein n=1 Tax=Streptomyces ortus TaxID=2867268 RepID=A0ABT3V2C9_9ACTN|nr:hypothetical protein [Streptomyces ortus]MCX4232800.1 hypothetical protein [Streptomyces ortus]